MPPNGLKKPKDGESSNRGEQNSSSWSVVDAFRRGDPDAVRDVRTRVESIIAFQAYRIPVSDRDGLCQEVLSQLWQGVNKTGFDQNRGFWGFVQTVAARRCIDWRRKHRPTFVETVHVADATAKSPLALLLTRERRSMLAEAIEELPDEYQQLVDLRIRQGKPYAEIANLLGKSEQALRAQMYRCVGRLRDAIGLENDD